MTITIKGNDIDDVGTAASITVAILGVKPEFVDEGVRKTRSHGSFKSKRRDRLSFEITLADFEIKPSATDQDARTYFDFMQILSMEYKWISAFSDDVYRIKHPTMGLIADGRITLPIAVDVYEAGGTSEDFEASISEMDNVVLWSKRWYTYGL